MIEKRRVICGKAFEPIHQSNLSYRHYGNISNKKAPDAPNGTPGALCVSRMVRAANRRAGDCIKYPPCCASSRGREDLLMLFYHNSCKKKSQRVNVLPLALCTHFSEVCVLYFGRYKYYITHPAFYQCLSAGSLSPSGCNVSALQCPAAEAAQRTAKELSFGLPSQVVRS